MLPSSNPLHLDRHYSNFRFLSISYLWENISYFIVSVRCAYVRHRPLWICLLVTSPTNWQAIWRQEQYLGHHFVPWPSHNIWRTVDEYSAPRITGWIVMYQLWKDTSDNLSLMPLHIWIMQPSSRTPHTDCWLTKLYSDYNLATSPYTHRKGICWFTNVSISSNLFSRHVSHHEWMH